MGQEIKLIRKEFRITSQEEKLIKEIMKEQKVINVNIKMNKNDKNVYRQK